MKFLAVLFCFVFASTASSQTAALPFRPGAAVYSTALDRIIFISGTPNQLHIYNPVTHADQTVSLPEGPQNLSLSANGLYAAVALVDSVSYVNLQNASVVQTFANVAVNGGTVILGSGIIYVYSNQSRSVLAIQISNGQVSTALQYAYGTYPLYNPDAHAIYSTEDGDSPNNISRYNVSGSTVSAATTDPYFGEFCIGGPLWLSPDRSKLYTGCGTVFSSALDSSNDLHYQGLFGSQNSIQSLASSNALNQIAYIPAIAANDTSIHLVDAASYNKIGQFQTTPFTVGASTYTAHGRWVFYDAASTRLFVVTQADSSAGLAMDYAIDTVNLQNANSCNATFASTAASASAAGGYATTQILSGVDCAFTAVSNVPWITLTAGYYGSGNTALTYLVRPNVTSSARSGTITMGTSMLFVTQDGAASASSSIRMLSVNPVAADYDKTQDRIVMVNSSPNELHIYDPVSQADQIIPLSGAPLSVSVDPSGLFAAVGHHGFLSYVDLSALIVVKTIPIDMDIGSLLLAGNGYAYVFPSATNATSKWDSVQLSTGNLSSLQNAFTGGSARLYSAGGYMYVGNSTYYCKFDISAGPAVAVNPYTSLPGSIWMSDDGTRLVSSLGLVYTISTTPARDLLRVGSLSEVSSIAWAANSVTQHQTAVLTSSLLAPAADTQLQIYSDNNLQLLSQLAMPLFSNNGTSYIANGRYLFWNAAETQLFAITQADSASGLLNSFALNTIAAPESIPACTYGVSPGTIYVNANSGYSAVWNINVTSSCSWSAAAVDTTWLYLSTGTSPTVGNGTVTFGLGTNSGAQRSQNIQIGNQSVNVVQAAATCTYALSSTSAFLPLSGGTAGVEITTQPSCPWSVQSNSSWLTAASQSGTGSALIPYSAAPAVNTSYQVGHLTIAGSTLTVTLQGFVSSNPLNFVPVTPCRVADTRNATGALGGPFLVAGASRSFPIPSSACNIPGNAAAYSFNVAVVPHGALGYLTAWATGQPQPPVSTVNSADGRVKSAAAIVTAGTSGAVSFFTTNDTDLVLDINGYFIPSAGNTGLNYNVLNPCRVADTRNAAGALGGPLLAAAQQRDLPVQQSACNVPAQAQAYSVNLAVVPSAGGLGYLSLWPAGQQQPVVASLNAPTGAVTSNAALLSAGTGGDVEIMASNNAQVIMDINGYFAVPSTSGLHLYTVQPCRLLDTRTAGTKLPFTGTLSVAVGGNCNIPSSASAVVVNATAVPAGPLGYLTLWADGQAQPTVAALNASDGVITSNMAIVPMLDGVIDAFASNGTHLVLDVAGYFAP